MASGLTKKPRAEPEFRKNAISSIRCPERNHQQQAGTAPSVCCDEWQRKTLLNNREKKIPRKSIMSPSRGKSCDWKVPVIRSSCDRISIVAKRMAKKNKNKVKKEEHTRFLVPGCRSTRETLGQPSSTYFAFAVSCKRSLNSPPATTG